MKEVTITLDDWEEEIIDFIKNGYNASQEREVVDDEEVIHGIIASFVAMKTIQAEEAELNDAITGSGLRH